MKKIVLFTALICIAHLAFAAIDPDAIIGIWKDGKGKGHVQIFKQNGKYYGKVIWLNNPKDVNGKPKVDKNNPNESLRNKPLLGLTMLKNFNTTMANGRAAKFIIRPMERNIKHI